MNYLAVVFGALMAGAIFGAVPAVLGYNKGKNGLAIAGFISCVVCSFIGGMFLSIPCCIIFVVIILLTKKNNG